MTFEIEIAISFDELTARPDEKSAATQSNVIEVRIYIYAIKNRIFRFQI